MDHFLWIGSLLGALCGALHAPLVFRNRRRDEGASPLRAGYYALWAFALWTLFGAYLLLFWLIGATGMALSRLLRPSRRGAEA